MSPVTNGRLTNGLAAGLLGKPADDRRRGHALLRREAGAVTGIAKHRGAIVAAVEGEEKDGSDQLVFEAEVDAIERITHATDPAFAAAREHYEIRCDTT